MKELSTEEKAKAYDEAVINGSRLWECGEITRENYEYIFPELKDGESEDEKIRKALIKYFTLSDDNADYQCCGVHYKDIVAWLEKQANHANFCNNIQIGDKVTRNEDGVLVNLSQLNRVAKKQGKQKPTDKVEPRFKIGDKIISTISNIPYYITEVCDEYYLTDVGCFIMFNAQDNFELSEQKPAWSEEDEKAIEDACYHLNRYGNSFNENNQEIANTVFQVADRLKSLKDRVQPNSAWSKKDRRMLIGLIDELDAIMNKTTPNEISVYSKYTNWLKSLRPHSQWKPSDEQMERLKGTINSLPHQEVLYSLYQDLKKLRGE